MALQYYDLVLGAIFVSLLVGALVGAYTAVSILVATVVACTVAVGMIGHALFVRGPVDALEDLSEEVDAVGPIEFAD
ncbi:hypothetical protein [Halalkalicoccus subterraneus]|uniref:hypothetical protein n=1 Tax=Halalkalicoccus subterraneus TaxID=2675002 RepID=UPI000EFC9C9C|nr:hypothetical protein [Halalkalicoccus subterraneus]